MKKLKDIMSANVQCLSPDMTLQQFATKMKELDCGAIPVCESDRLVGMVTDRDIIVKALATGMDLNTATAREVMTSPVIYCFDDQDMDDAARLMEVQKVRRLIVLDRAKKLVGIVSLGDVSVRGGGEDIAFEILRSVSEHTNKEAA